MSVTDIICITGAARKQLDNVAAILANAGMAAPAPATRDKQLDLARWHEQVLAAAADKGADPHSQTTPGRLWEQLAGDVFVANMQNELWGWADSRSTWLLDFWLNFEPNLKFILVCVSPQQMLAEVLAEDLSQTNGELPVEKTITRWITQHKEMLRFHNRHPQRSLLVTADDCVGNSDALLAQCRDKWQLPLTEPGDTFVAPSTADAMFCFLADQLCRDVPELESLNHELAATMTRFGPDELLSPPVEQAIAHYQNLLADHAQAEVSARQLRKDLDQQLELHDKLTQEHQTRIAQLGKERDDQSRVAKDQQAHIEQLNNKCASQLQQIQELTSKLEQASREQEALAKTKTIAEQARQSAEQQLKSNEDKLRDSTEENELLLLQLHQVQEELEHYFLRHQEAQQKLKLAEDKWQQMMQRNPDYCEYDSLEMISNDDTQQTAPRWCFKGLHVAGRSFDQLEFSSVLEQGIGGLVFERKPEPAGALLRWPTVAADQDELAVIPVAQHNNRQQRVETLFDLAAGDWTLMKALVRVMQKELASAGSSAQQYFAEHQAGQLAPMQAGLRQFQSILDAFPATFRFDSLALKHEQANPGYEHLWLRCENVSYGNQNWPAFEFRVACANVTPDSFGNDPKLEFPQANDATPLSGWFAESQDNFGDKLELRFALPDAMDVNVWKRLPLADQQFVTALINRLPVMLQTLQNTQTTLQRPWDEWIGTARELARIFTEQTTPAEARGQLAATQGEGAQ